MYENIKNTRQLQAEHTRNHILDTATQLIKQKPVSDIKMRDILQASGVSAGTFYHYFSSKDELFARIALEPTISELLDIKAASDKALMERLTAYFNIRSSLFEQQGLSMIRNLQQFRMTGYYRDIREQLIGSGHFDYELLHTIFQDAVTNNELSKNLPISFFSEMIVYTVHGIVFNQSLYDEPLQISSWLFRWLDYLEHTLLAPYWLNKKNVASAPSPML